MQFANKINSTMGEDYTPNLITATEAFHHIHGDPVTFNRVAEGCDSGCWGWTESATEIYVYSNAKAEKVAAAPHFIMHELGHAFERRMFDLTGHRKGREALEARQQNDPTFPDRPEINDGGSPWGFAGHHEGESNPNQWQQSADHKAGEEFADMYVGWVEDAWANDEHGKARDQFMEENMPRWVWDTIEEDKKEES